MKYFKRFLYACCCFHVSKDAVYDEAYDPIRLNAEYDTWNAQSEKYMPLHSPHRQYSMQNFNDEKEHST
jgi:hypothetical protein